MIKIGFREAREILESIMLIDTHIDAPYQMGRKSADLSRISPEVDFDLVRARTGGLSAGFMAAYVPAKLARLGGARREADRLIDQIEKLINDHPSKVRGARSPTEIRVNKSAGLLSLPVCLENGSALESDLQNVRHFHERGITYMTLTHARDNELCDSSYDDRRTWHGISPFGRLVVTEMNRLGMIVDISHASDEAAAQIIDHSETPVVATHSSARHFTPGFERNLDDTLIRQMASRGGVIQINFGSRFLTEVCCQNHNRFEDKMRNILAEKGLTFHSPEAEPIMDVARDSYSIGYADVADVARHIDYVVQLVGIDHAGIGSDFDGVGDTLPTGLKDVSMYPNLIVELWSLGYRQPDLKKICGENFLRVWEKVAEHALSF